jgi:hypothetical protein
MASQGYLRDILILHLGYSLGRPAFTRVRRTRLLMIDIAARRAIAWTKRCITRKFMETCKRNSNQPDMASNRYHMFSHNLSVISCVNNVFLENSAVECRGDLITYTFLALGIPYLRLLCEEEKAFVASNTKLSCSFSMLSGYHWNFVRLFIHLRWFW